MKGSDTGNNHLNPLDDPTKNQFLLTLLDRQPIVCKPIYYTRENASTGTANSKGVGIAESGQWL